MTSTIQASDVTQTVNAYFRFLNETDSAGLRKLAEKAWAEDARYIDPHHDGQGRETLISLAEAVHAAYPGYAFRRTSEIDCHHDRARYAWEFVDPAGAVIMTGVDYAAFDSDGRLKLVVGFHGDMPAL